LSEGPPSQTQNRQKWSKESPLGKLSPDEAELAKRVPLAEDVTAEADSGGHTDRRPLPVLIPIICAFRDQVMAERKYDRPIRVGAAGGIGTPQSVAAAFALGAAYVLTGSVNQSAIEAGTSNEMKKKLAEASYTDVTMAPAADMFEKGVEVQVLKKGTMFPQRAEKLFRLYSECESIDAIPDAARAEIEKDIFRDTLANVWAATESFWKGRDPEQIEKAAKDPKHKMALVFRSYVGQTSRWATNGTPDRTDDYQAWCGPAIGGFNEWVSGSFLSAPEGRTVVQIALNLMHGAVRVTRANALRAMGVPIPDRAFWYAPREM
jgi:PfaD family protein